MKKQQKCMQEDATRTGLAIRSVGKREGKRGGSKVKEEEIEKIYEERRDRDGDVKECNENGQVLLEDIEYPWEGFAYSWNVNVVDEQMPYWCTSWCPSWDVEYINDMYTDVFWDDDIWDLKAMKDVPTLNHHNTKKRCRMNTRS